MTLAAAVGVLELTGTIANSGTFDSTATLDLVNATVNGGTLEGAGTIATATGNTLSTLNGVTVDSGTVVAAAVGVLELTGTIANSGTFDSTATLDLVNATVNGGTLEGAGTIATATGNTLSTLNGVTIDSGTVVAAAVGVLELTGTIANSGTFDSTATLDLVNATVNGGTVTNNSGGTIDLTGSGILKNGSLGNSGQINVSGTGNALDDETVTANNALEVLAGGALLIDQGSTVANGSGTITVDATGTLTLNDTTIYRWHDQGQRHAVGHWLKRDRGSTVNGGGNLSVASGQVLTLDAVTLDNVTLTGSVSISGTLTIDDTVTLNDATITGGTVTDNGIIEAVGSVDITGNISGTGSLQILNTAILELGGSVSGQIVSGSFSGETVFFETGQGELILDNSKQFSGLITGSLIGAVLTSADQIDLRDLSFISGSMSATVSYNSTTNISTVVFSDGTPANDITLRFSGDYTNDSWQFTSDGNGGTPGTLVESSPPDQWANLAGGTWDDPTNWSGGTPTSTTNVAIDAPGTYTVTSTANVDIGSLVLGSGVTLLADPNTTFIVEGNVTNNGTIEAGPFNHNQISVIDLKGDVSGTGLIEITNKGVVEIGGSVSGQILNGSFVGETVLFAAGQGELILDDSAQFHGLIESSSQGTKLSTGDKIDLRDLAFVAGHMSETVTYDSTTNTSSVSFSNGTATINILFLGNYSNANWTFTSDGNGAAPGTMVSDPLNSGTATIDSGAILDIAAASAVNVIFGNQSGTTGALVLNDSADFTGVITGFAGDGTLSNSDSIDLKDVNIADVATNKTTYTDNGNGTGTLTLFNASGQALDSITFAGSYQLANFTIESDGNGHTLIVDPPAASPLEIATGASLEIANPVALGESVKFDGSTGHLTLDAPSSFDGLISGFTGDGTLARSDQIDLKGIDYHSSSFTESFDAATDTLSISDGTNSATLHFSGSYQAANFSFQSDDNGGTIISDLPVPNGAGPQTPVQSQTQDNSHGFTFNFTGNEPHPTPEMSGGQLPWTPPAGPNSTAGHPAGTLLVSPEMAPHLTSDVHLTIGVVVPSLIEAQTHANGFHLV